MNATISAIRSWLWVPLAWVIVYPAALLLGIYLGAAMGPAYYWWGTFILVPLLVIPLTFKMLVGGGCSVRFQICALVKGMLAGFVFLLITMGAEPLVWANLSSLVGWSPLPSSISELVYYTWLFSATIGGMGARIVEVRGYSDPSAITIVGYE